MRLKLQRDVGAANRPFDRPVDDNRVGDDRPGDLRLVGDDQRGSVQITQYRAVHPDEAIGSNLAFDFQPLGDDGFVGSARKN
jgi:hypothetical protein